MPAANGVGTSHRASLGSQRSAAPILCGVGYAVFSFAPRPRGAERREARVLARHPGTPTWRAGNASEAFRDPKRKGPLTSRRSTCGFFAIPGRAFHAALAPRDQPAPGGWIVVPTRRCPGPPECEVTSLARGSRTSLRLQNVSGDAPR